MSDATYLELDILELLAHGWTTKRITAQLGCSESYVRKVRKRHNYPVRRPDAETHQDRVIELTRKGLSASHIAKMLHLSKRHVVRIRADTGNQVGASPVLLTEDELLRAKALLQDGASCTEVARTLGHSPRTIARRFPEFGWTTAQTAQFIKDTHKLRKLVDL